MAWTWRTLGRERWAEAGELLGIVAARYPVLVARPAKPLAIGTGDRLKEAATEIGLTGDQADLVMVRVTRTSSYLAALARGGPRNDLDGEIAGEVGAHDRKAAAAILAARRARRARKHAAIARRSEDCGEQSAGADDSAELRDADLGEASHAGEASEADKPNSADDRAVA